jgi:hypothetical protein
MNKPPFPKEHGSWAMLTIPLLLGLMVAPAWHWHVLVLLVAAGGVLSGATPIDHVS